MKILHFIFFIVLVCHSLANAQSLGVTSSITVKLDDPKKSYQCNLDSNSNYYLCPNNGQPILVKNSYFGLVALTSEDSGLVTKAVTSAETNGKVFFQGPPSNSSPPKDLAGDYESRVAMVEGFFQGNLSADLKSVKDGSGELKKLASKFLEEKEKLKQTALNAFQDNNYQVELSDGQKVSCARGETRPLTAQELQSEKMLGQKTICGVFQCGSVVVDGKSYKATMLYSSNPGSIVPGTMHLSDENGIGPKTSIKKISTANSKVPVVDSSHVPENLRNPQDFYRPMVKNMIPESIPEREKVIDYKSPGFSMVFQSYQNICGKDNPVLRDLEVARNKLMLNLANANLAEFIQVLANGKLYGHFIDPNLASTMGCNYNGVYLDQEAARHIDRLKKNIHPDRNVDQTITMERANQLFKKAQAMEDIAWKYKPDGCYARAHLMARRFEEEGVRVDKVWIKGDLYVPGTPIQWNFHVAPIVYIKNAQGQTQKMVIDPSLFDKPVTVEEWDNKMAKNTARGSSVTTFPFPENAAIMERSVLAFSSSDPYLPGDSIHMSEEDKMKKADETMRRYKLREPK